MGIGHNGISIEDVRLNCGTVGYNGHTMPKVDGLSFFHIHVGFIFVFAWLMS
jgi:hypothetical protein